MTKHTWTGLPDLPDLERTALTLEAQQWATLAEALDWTGSETELEERLLKMKRDHDNNPR
jgi:hypothetical protein